MVNYLIKTWYINIGTTAFFFKQVMNSISAFCVLSVPGSPVA